MYSPVGMQVVVLQLLAVVVPFAQARLAAEMFGGGAYCSVGFEHFPCWATAYVVIDSCAAVVTGHFIPFLYHIVSFSKSHRNHGNKSV